MKNIHFRAFFSQIMTLAGGGFAFAPALHPALSISLQGLVHFSISKLISPQSLSILMRVALVPYLTGGETEGKKIMTIHHKRCCEPVCVCVGVLLCTVDAVSMCLSAFTSPQQNKAWKTFPFHSQDRAITCTPEASQLIIRSEGKYGNNKKNKNNNKPTERGKMCWWWRT